MTSDDEILFWIREILDHAEYATEAHKNGYRCRACLSGHAICKLIREHLFRSVVFTKPHKPERKKRK